MSMQRHIFSNLPKWNDAKIQIRFRRKEFLYKKLTKKKKKNSCSKVSPLPLETVSVAFHLSGISKVSRKFIYAFTVPVASYAIRVSLNS